MAKHSSESLSAARAAAPQQAVPSSAPAGQTVTYPDGSGLARPLTLPKRFMPIVAVIALVALLVGGVFASRSIDQVVNYRERQAQAVEEALNRGIGVDPIVLAEYTYVPVDDIIARQAAAGHTVIDMSEANERHIDEIDLLKISDDLTQDAAMALYEDGMSRISAPDAVRFLSGTWRLNQRYEGTEDKRVRYADFFSGTPEAAISKAMSEQGFDPESVVDSGVDSNGNTYKTGNITIGENSFVWTVSCCALEEVYDVDFLPAGSQYVGVRLTASNTSDRS